MPLRIVKHHLGWDDRLIGLDGENVLFVQIPWLAAVTAAVAAVAAAEAMEPGLRLTHGSLTQRTTAHQYRGGLQLGNAIKRSSLVWCLHCESSSYATERGGLISFTQVNFYRITLSGTQCNREISAGGGLISSISIE